jgi:hypothetical protein
MTCGLGLSMVRRSRWRLEDVEAVLMTEAAGVPIPVLSASGRSGIRSLRADTLILPWVHSLRNILLLSMAMSSMWSNLIWTSSRRSYRASEGGQCMNGKYNGKKDAPRTDLFFRALAIGPTHLARGSHLSFRIMHSLHAKVPALSSCGSHAR